MAQRAPAMFIGHGSPMFALQPGKAGALLHRFSRNFTAVQAVLMISPHWMSKELVLTSADDLETIHDFYGFPDPLYRVQYAAPGSRFFAQKVQQQLAAGGYNIALDSSRGRDHGAWVPMMHLLPEAKIPVLQLSLDRTLSAAGLIALGEALKPLRDQGIAVIASGSLTHNLNDLQPLNAEPVAYAVAFEQWVREAVQRRDTEQLSNPQHYSQECGRAHPTDEHYVPLLLALGASDSDDELQVLEGGILHGVLSMESYGWV